MFHAGRLLEFAAVAAVVIAIPGPSVLFTVRRALTTGRRTALLNVLGNEAGLLMQVIAVAFGMGVVVERSARVFTVIKLLGAVYLVYYRRAVAVPFAAAPGGSRRYRWPGDDRPRRHPCRHGPQRLSRCFCLCRCLASAGPLFGFRRSRCLAFAGPPLSVGSEQSLGPGQPLGPGQSLGPEQSLGPGQPRRRQFGSSGPPLSVPSNPAAISCFHATRHAVSLRAHPK